jgi:hypothetical protein
MSNTATVLGLCSAVLISIDTVQLLGIGSGIAAVVAFTLALISRRKQQNATRSAFEALRQNILLDRVLDSAARHLGFGAQGGGWRLTLYELNVESGNWESRARASSNELYSGDRDHSSFTPAQGVLRDCINGSERPGGRFDEIPQLSDASSETWFSVLKSWGFSKAILQQLQMKSRSYCGAVFKVGPQNGHQVTLGVVAESEAPDGVNVRDLEQGLTRPFFEALAELLALRDSLQKQPTDS